MIAIVDYGVGNLFSLVSSFKAIGVEAVVTDKEEVIAAADKLILPGVGAFGDARRKLAETGMDKLVLREAQKGKPIMGICLGMQLLFEKGYEYGTHEGLGLLKGEVMPLRDTLKAGYKIPHIGWNNLIFKQDNPLFRRIQDGDFVYFVHSYHVKNCDDSLLATTEYGMELTAAVAKGNIYGCQFHPEKSGHVGLDILRGFVEL